MTICLMLAITFYSVTYVLPPDVRNIVGIRSQRGIHMGSMNIGKEKFCIGIGMAE